MHICLSHSSALRFWRSAYGCQLAGPRDPFYEADTPDRKRFSLPKLLPYSRSLDELFKASRAQRATAGSIPDAVPEVDMIELSLLSTVGVLYPCHAITRHQSQRSRMARVINHVCSVSLPQNSAVWLTDCLGVVSPELLFVQMAENLSFVELVELGFELCGYYSRSVVKGEKYLERRQLTSVDSLSRFLNEAGRLRGAKAAKRALKFVLDGSASPMETKLAMLMTLPFTRGGYNLARPQMNGNVEVGRGSKREIKTCDLLWREARMVVEYDGEEGHADHARRTSDARRFDLLSEAGYLCTTVTYGRLLDESDMDAIAQKVAQRLGARFRPRVGDYPERKRALRRSLFNIDD